MSRAPRLSQHELDEEFERFLKESLSDADDSMDASKRKKFSHPQNRAKEKEKKKSSQQPWWMDDEDQDDGGQRGPTADNTPSANKWLKPKKQSTPVIAEDNEDDEGSEVRTPVKLSSRHEVRKENDFGSGSEASDDYAKKTKPSMSRDSLENTPSPRGKIKPNYDSDEFESDNEDKSGVQPAHGSLEDTGTMSYTGPSEGTTVGSTGVGGETMEEMADKNRFFKELEEKEGGRIDYTRLNKDIDMTGTLGTMGSLPSPYMGTADEHSSPLVQIKRHSDESRDTSDEVDTKSKEESSSKASPATVKESKKPSMLSRVALLDTANSSTLNVSKDQLTSPEKGGAGEGDATLQTVESKGLLGTADDMEALHALLRDAANTPTMGLEDSSYGQTHLQDNPTAKAAVIGVPQPRTVEDILKEVQEEKKQQKHKEKEQDNRRRQEEEEQRRKEEEVMRKHEKMRRKVEEEKYALLEDSTDGKVGEPSGFDLSPINTQDGKGLDLEPTNQGRGYDDFQPANDGRGYDLEPENGGRANDFQPTNEGRANDLQPANDGSGFNRQPVSADDEASYGISSSTPNKKGKPKLSGKSRGRYGNIKSSGYGNKAKTKNSEVWSPAEAAKQKVKGAEVPMLGRKGPANRHLMHSVESFATYIQEHFADSRKLTPPPEVRHSREEPIISSTMQESKIGHLSREKALVAEINEWQNQWKEAHRLHAKLKAELATQRREFVRKEEEQRLLHEKEMFKLKQDNFVLQAKLNSEEEQKVMKKRAVSGRPIEGASEENIKLMQKEIIEQETLLQGYQQENERLYKQARNMQTSNKESEEVLFKANQKLQIDLANVRELLEEKDVALRHKGIITGVKIQQEIAAGNTAVLGAGIIAELQAQLQEHKINEIEVKQQVRTLEQTKKELELHIESVVRERNHSQEKVTNLRDVKQREFHDMQQQYKREIEGLQKKLRWYADNQELLDKDSQTLKEKDDELNRVRETLEKANKQAGHKSQDAQRRAKERAADAKKIQDLERQVKEMNDIIRRRYPNSLPALIYAAASASGEGQDSHPPPPPSQKSHTAAFLEEKVSQLEKELTRKDEDVKRSLRVMEQKYNIMKFQYEDRVKKLEKNLQDLRANSTTRPHTNITALDRELHGVKEKYQRKLRETHTENEELRKRLANRSTRKPESGGDGVNDKEDEGVGFSAAELQEKLTLLARELSSKDQEIEMLKGACDKLMQERFQPGQTKGTQARRTTVSRKPGSEDDAASKQYEPANFAGSHISDVLMENEHLKNKTESLCLEMEQQRLRVQATLAEAESNVRKTQEATAEEMSAMKSRHVEEMERLMAERALSHSDSQVARLTNQVESQRVLIGHLQEQLSDVRVEADAVAASHVREQVITTQLDQLRLELHDAKKSHTPEMRHFEALQSKICAMEARHSQREQELHLLVERAKHSATIEKDQEIAHCRQQLTNKNAEIHRFRAELDSILEVLRELQRQGVVLPLHSHAVQSLL